MKQSWTGFWRASLAACALGGMMVTAHDAFAASCSDIHKTCVARCKRDNAADKLCPSDHCDPKLAQCRSTGCWQEGQRYGGALTCDLTKK